jgi:hypothetical protein
VKLAVFREAFDRPDRGAVGLNGQASTRLRGHTVHQDGAGAALAGITADFGAHQSGNISDEVHEQEPRFDISFECAAIQNNFHGQLHGSILPGSSQRRAPVGSAKHAS